MRDTAERPSIPAKQGPNGAKSTTRVTISEPNFRFAELHLRGLTPYVQLRFSEKARKKMAETMEAGSTARKGAKREPRDFEADYMQAFYTSQAGWHGIPAPAFRNAAIDACRMVGFHMTKAKMSIFVTADGQDASDGTPLVRIYGSPERFDAMVRNASGVADIRVRAQWRRWGVVLRVRYDGDQFTETDVVNLFARAGMQVGVGEGRPFSKDSNGIDRGQFELVSELQEEDYRVAE